MQRFVTGACLAVMLAVVLALGGWVFSIVALLAIGLALHEEYNALTAAGHRPVSWPTWVGFVATAPLVLSHSYRIIVPVLMGICIVTFAQVIFREKPKLEDALMSILPLLSISLPGMFLISFTSVSSKALEVTLLCLVFVIAVLGDTMAYFVGSHVGGRKLCPAASPKKTVSGAIGGLIGSVIGAFLVGGVAALCAPASAPLLPPAWHYLLLGLIGGVAAQIGDLFASMVKRHCGIKDFSGMFPGHGGMMDRLDSILFVTMIVFCYRMML